MRFWLSSSFGLAVLSVLSCFHAESILNRGIGDGGPALKATLYGPTGLALDENNLYIVESFGKRVRRVNLKTGIIMTIAGGGAQCREEQRATPERGCLDYPQRVAVDLLGNVYVTDEGIAGVVKIGADAHSFSTVVAGSVKLSPESERRESVVLRWPAGIAVDSLKGVFFDDYTGHTIYRLPFQNNSLEIVAGNGKEGFKGNGGPGRDAEFRFPDGLVRDQKGNLFVADDGNCRIQRVESETGIVTTVIGTEENGSTCEGLPDGAALDQPTDVDVDQNGNVFFVQQWRNRVRRIEMATGRVSTVAGNGESGFSGDGGPAVDARLHRPTGIAVDRNGEIYVSDSNNGRVRRVDMKTRTITTFAGNGPILPDLIL